MCLKHQCDVHGQISAQRLVREFLISMDLNCLVGLKGVVYHQKSKFDLLVLVIISVVVIIVVI